MSFVEAESTFFEMQVQLQQADETGLGLNGDDRLFWRKRLSELQAEIEEKYDAFFSR